MKSPRKFIEKATLLICGLGFAFSIILLSSFTFAKPWVKLGSQAVTYKVDHDELYVTARQGTFRKLKVEVDKSNIHISKMIVFYRHGAPETVHIKKNILAGSSTRALDLKGNNRIIYKVVFYYNTHLYEGKRAKVTLLGMH